MRQSKLLFLFVVLLSIISNKSFAYDIAVDGIYYNFLSDNTLEVTYKEITNNTINNSNYWGAMKIPSTVLYKGTSYDVTSIGYMAFAYCNRLSSITMPHSITTISDDAFFCCYALTSVSMSNNTKSIGKSVFYNCQKLESIQIPDNTTNIGSQAFSNCISLKKVTLPISIYSIENGTFYGCSSLEEIDIPNSVVSIGGTAFYNCSKLKYIIIPDGIDKFQMYTFQNCRELRTIVLGRALGNIAPYTFEGCPNIKEIYTTNPCPSCSIWVDREQFDDNCYKNAVVYVPQGSKDYYSNKKYWGHFNNIKEYDTSNINSIINKLKGNNSDSDSEQEIVGITFEINGIKYKTTPNFECEVIAGGNYSGKIVIPDKTTFNGKEYRVTSIGKLAFDGCKSLTSVTIPNSVKSIGYAAFFDCGGLTSVIIPNSVSSIGEKVFIECNNLSSLTIGSGVTSIGDYAFDVTNIQTVISLISNPFTIKSNIFSQQTYQKAILYVPKGTKAKYKANGGWNNFTYIAEEGEVIDISEGSIEFEVNGIKYQTVSSTECKIISGSGCSGDIVIPEKITSNGKEYTVTSIGTNAFKGCRSLTSVSIPNSVTVIGSEAFRGCEYLTSVNIPNGVTYIGDWAFCATNITSITIPNGVTSLEESIFNGCDNLSSVTIPNSVNSIGRKAFYRCLSLSSINIPNNVTSIGELAFWECRKLTSINIPNSVTSIGANAFDGEAEDIPSIQIIISLIENPFEIYGKTSYKSPNGKDYLGVFNPNTFNNATLYVPKGTINKYKATNGWKDFLFIEEGIGPNGGETPETKKCEIPTIYYQNGKLIFNCATEGATCQYMITDDDIKSGSANELQLGVTYRISVYATKTGYMNSETATATLCWIDAEPKTEGITNTVANVRALPLLIQSNGSTLTVSGTDDGTPVTVYSINGTKAGYAISQNGEATIYTTLQSGSAAIVKVGNKSVKVMVK